MAKRRGQKTEKKEENPNLNCVSPVLKEKEGKPDKPWCKENVTPEWRGSQGEQEICRVLQSQENQKRKARANRSG